jgi:hypothetical protein
MRAFRSRLRRSRPLLPPLRLRLLPSPPLPACRFPHVPALSALAPLLAMPTLALFPASAPATAPSFSVGVLPLVRLALALVLNGLAFLGGLACLGALGTVRSTNATGASCGGMRWSRVDSDIPRLMAGLCVLPVRSGLPSLLPPKELSSRDGASNEARPSPRAPERRDEPGRDTGP